MGEIITSIYILFPRDEDLQLGHSQNSWMISLIHNQWNRLFRPIGKKYKYLTFVKKIHYPEPDNECNHKGLKLGR